MMRRSLRSASVSAPRCVSAQPNWPRMTRRPPGAGPCRRRTCQAESYVPDAVLTLQPTSPLRAARHIDDAAALFAADPSADSLVSCIEVPHIFHPLSVMRRNSEGYLEPFFSTPQPHRRQDKQQVFARNGAAITSRAPSGSPNTCLAGDFIPYPMDQESSVDIDTLEDLVAAERLLLARA